MATLTVSASLFLTTKMFPDVFFKDVYFLRVGACCLSVHSHFVMGVRLIHAEWRVESSLFAWFPWYVNHFICNSIRKGQAFFFVQFCFCECFVLYVEKRQVLCCQVQCLPREVDKTYFHVAALFSFWLFAIIKAASPALFGHSSKYSWEVLYLILLKCLCPHNVSSLINCCIASLLMIMGFVYFPQRTGQLCRGFSQIMREFNTCFSQRIDIKHILQPPPLWSQLLSWSVWTGESSAVANDKPLTCEVTRTGAYQERL